MIQTLKQLNTCHGNHDTVNLCQRNVLQICDLLIVREKKQHFWVVKNITMKIKQHKNNSIPITSTQTFHTTKNPDMLISKFCYKINVKRFLIPKSMKSKLCS